MINTIKRLNPSWPVIDTKTGIPNDRFRLFISDVLNRGLYIGTGSPEGLLEAVQGEEYMDETVGATTVKYIKQSPDIAGDRKKGWVAIG